MIPDLTTIGKWLVLFGIAIVICGLVIMGLSRITGWEKFPGTLRLQAGNLTCVIPILGSIIFSILLTVLLNVLARYFNR